MCPHSPLLSFFDHPNFYTAFTEPAYFQAWTQSGLWHIRDLVTSNFLKTFLALQAQTQLPSKECFQYVQIAHFTQAIIGSHSSLDILTLYEGICDSDPHTPGIISRLYSHLTSPPASLPPYATQWSKDLEIDLDAEDWKGKWANTKASSQNVIAL